MPDKVMTPSPKSRKESVMASWLTNSEPDFPKIVSTCSIKIKTLQKAAPSMKATVVLEVSSEAVIPTESIAAPVSQ